MPRSKLTPSQLAAKKRVESEGGVFVHPKTYLSDHHKKKSYGRGASDKAVKRAYNTQPMIMESLHPTTESLVNQILDPESASANGLERWPELMGLSGIYHSKNIIDAKFATDNRCSVYVHPRLSNSIFTTSGAESIVTLTKASPTANHPVFQDYVQIKAGLETEISCPIYVSGDECLLKTPNPTINTDGMYPGQFIVLPGDNVWIDISFDAAADLSIQGELYLMDNTGAIVMGVITSSYDSVNNRLRIIIPGTGLIPHTHFAIKFTSLYDYSGSFKAIITQDTASLGASTFKLFNQAEHCDVADIKDANVFFDDADKYSVVSQSLLCTSQMSSLNNAGTIGAARVSGAIASQGDNSFSNTYQFLSSLPTNSYDGPVKDGCYVWNLYDDKAAYFYKNVREGHNLDQPYLCAQFTVDAGVVAASPVRIKVNTVVQFKTTSSIFSLAPSEYIGEELPKMLHLLSLIPAAYSNGLHKRDLKKYLKQAGDMVVKVMKNPKTYSTLAKYGPMLASFLA